MATSNRRNSRRVLRQTSDLAIAAPLVVAHRLTRMMTAGANPGARDRRDFQRMGEEKVAAFGESWNAMAWQMLRSNQTLALSLMAPWWRMRFDDWSMLFRPIQAWQSASINVLGKGIAPVRRRAVANARRLSKPASG